MYGSMDPQTMMLLQMMQRQQQSPQYTAAPVQGNGMQVAQSPGANVMGSVSNLTGPLMQAMMLRKMMQRNQPPLAQGPKEDFSQGI